MTRYSCAVTRWLDWNMLWLLHHPSITVASTSLWRPEQSSSLSGSGHGKQRADNNNRYARITASPSRQNFVCLVRSRLQCHVRRHRHARNKGKFGSYAFLHATPSDYIRSHCTSYFTWSFFFLWIFRDVSKHQSCGMKCYNFLTFDVLNKMNLLLSKLFSFTFMWES